MNWPNIVRSLPLRPASHTSCRVTSGEATITAMKRSTVFAME